MFPPVSLLHRLIYKPHTSHNSFIRSDEGLALETSAFVSLYGGQFTLSIQLIKQNFHVSLPHRRSTTFSLETNPFYSLTKQTTFRGGDTTVPSAKRREKRAQKYPTDGVTLPRSGVSFWLVKRLFRPFRRTDPDLGSVTSSVRYFYAHFSDVFSRREP